MIQTYSVRGLTFWRCMVSVIDEVHSLPRVDGVQGALTPFGASRVGGVPTGRFTRVQVRVSRRAPRRRWKHLPGCIR